MTYVTSIGLDVHARSVSACAFDPFTGEVAQRTFGTDAAEIAGWILGFEEPKAVYGSGPTGFALCRELRAPGVDCVVGAVSRMQRPSAEKRRFSRFPTAGSYASWLGLAPSERSSGEKEARGDQGQGRRRDGEAQPPPRRPARRRQAGPRRERGGRARARVLGPGDRQAGRGDARLARRADRIPLRRGPRIDASPGPAQEHFTGGREAAPDDTDFQGVSRRGPRTENRNAVARGDIRTACRAIEPADISLPGERRLTVIAAGRTGWRYGTRARVEKPGPAKSCLLTMTFNGFLILKKLGGY